MAKNELNFEDLVFNEERQELDYLELPLSRQTFLLMAVVVVVIGFIAFGQSFFLNVFKSSFYGSRAAANINKEVYLPAPRGIIYDRYGQPLVDNKNAFSVYVNAAELLKLPAKVEEAIIHLSDILKMDREDLARVFRSVELEKKNSVAVARNISLSQVIEIKSLNFPEIQITDDYARSYPDGFVFSHILGYVGVSGSNNDLVGKSGLEAQYDHILRGEDGLAVIYRNAAGQPLDQKVIEAPTAGSPLTTTIDADLQKYFYSRIKQSLAVLGSKAGVGIAMNPQTGEILALVSLPSFDNNEVAEYLNAANQPLFNRAISGIYTPGSAIKPLVALAALKEKITDPQDRVLSTGSIEIPNPYDPEKPSRFLDWKAHGWVNLHSALARSSNIYFYAVGGGLPKNEIGLAEGFSALKGLGIEKLREYWQKFLLGEKTGIDLPAENTGFLPDPEEKENRTGQIWRIGDTYNVSIGQGDLLLTPLQLLNFISSIANGGQIYKPHLVSNYQLPITNYQNEVLLDYSDWQEEIREVQQGLVDAVRKPYGTANLLSLLPISAAGKTGSSQVANNTRTNAFFVGYLPSGALAKEGAPEIAILVLVENAREGSLNAVPIAKDVLAWYYYNRLVKGL